MCDIEKKLVIVSGPSGAGKDTIVKKLIDSDSEFALSVSATTRPPRKGEIEGINYYYLSEKEFEDKVHNGAFIEYARYGSKYYGTLKSDVMRRIENGKIVVLVIEVQGAENVKRMYPNVLSIFIMPPSEEILENRLRNRMTDSDEDILRRMDIAKTEVKKSSEYDYTVVNDDLDIAVKQVYKIIKENIN